MTPKKKEETPEWYLVAQDEVGEKEVPGSGDNPRIIEYHSVTSLHATDDEVPWCSSFACWCMEQAGVRSPRSARALDWLDWGVSLDEGRLGCVCVFTRKGGGHVGFYVSEDESGIYVLGGNQSDAVNISHFGWQNLSDFRWPKKYPS